MRVFRFVPRVVLALIVTTLEFSPAISQDEPADPIARRFQQIDSNGDGKLSSEELKAVPVIRKLLEGADANGDGQLTIDEVRNFLNRRQAKQAKPLSNPAKTPPGEDRLQEAPRELPASTVGRRIPDVPFTDIHGKSGKLSDFSSQSALVIATLDTSCPLCKKYAPVLARLETAFRERGVVFLFVNPTLPDKPEALAALVKNQRLRGPYVHDKTHTISRALGISSTTEVFVLDRSRTLQYRGAIDDQYGLGYARETARKTYLADAIEAVLAGSLPGVRATTAPGCVLDFQPAASSGKITWHNQVARILQNNCQECHREGGLAPFPLQTREQVIARAGMIRKVVEKGTMPPWFAAPPARGEPSPFINDRSLSATDRADLLRWLASDRPEGDPTEAPLPRTFPTDWQIGKPDLVVQLPRPISIKAEGTMPYQNAVVETTLDEDRWVQGLEIQPTAREVVHHVLVFVAPPASGQKNLLERFREEAEERKGFFAAYVPGNSHVVYPDGYAKFLPRGSRLRFQLHYTPNGTATKDQTRLGLIFAKKPPQYEVKVTGVANVRLRIPPEAEHHVENARQAVPFDATLLGFMPHMHVRGKAFRYELVRPDGTRQVLLNIPRYDFNWQLYYRLAQPLEVSRGSRIEVTAVYDNSSGNPANPDPKKAVRWGPQTFDEMLIGYVEYLVPASAARK